MSLEERIEGCAGCGRLLIFGDSCLGCDVVEVLIEAEKAKAVGEFVDKVAEISAFPNNFIDEANIILEETGINKLLEDNNAKTQKTN